MSSSTKRKPQGSSSAAAGKKKRTVKPASDNDLAMVEQLTKQERKTANELKAAPIDSSTLSDVTEVREMNRAEVLTEIDLVLFKVLQSIIAGKGFEFNIPSRAASNQEYIKELDRIVLKRSKLMSRAFVNVSSAKKATYMARAITIVYEVLRKGIHTTKRDLFYSDAKLFGDQSNSDGVLGDIACLLGCTRTSLHVVASDRGVVVGRVRYVEDGDEIDCTKMGVGGKAIPPHLNKVENIQSDAKFILLVEKDAAFARLAEDRFYNTFPCIIITAKGQPDVASRRFLKRLRNTLQIPVLGLVDSDPYGLKILSVYMSGSKSMSYDSASLSTQGIKWLGVRPSDLDRYNIPEVCRLDMSAGDIKTGEALLKEDFIKQNPEWVAELELMLKTKKKAEIQALSSFGFQYLTQQYLPEKIKNGDWI